MLPTICCKSILFNKVTMHSFQEKDQNAVGLSHYNKIMLKKDLCFCVIRLSLTICLNRILCRLVETKAMLLLVEYFNNNRTHTIRFMAFAMTTSVTKSLNYCIIATFNASVLSQIY